MIKLQSMNYQFSIKSKIMEPNLNYVKNLFLNKNIHKIVNVYQQEYFNDTPQGFGDFLRGSFYLSYICNILDIEFDIDLNNHPMSMYLENNKNIYTIPYSEVKAYINHKNKHEHKFLEELFIDINDFTSGDTFYLFNNSMPPWFDTNIIQKARKIIIPKIEPNNNVLEILYNKLKTFDLSINNYAIIHIRCGDHCMNIKYKYDSEKHIISSKHLNDIIESIKKYSNKNKKYILIGDSNYFKQEIVKKFSNLHTLNSNICHTGHKTDVPILDTLLDFYLMRYSNQIISFSAYGHGSGFSSYCSTIYNIPFHQVILQPVLTYIWQAKMI